MSGAASATDGDFAVLVAELRRCGSKRLVSRSLTSRVCRSFWDSNSLLLLGHSFRGARLNWLAGLASRYCRNSARAARHSVCWTCAPAVGTSPLPWRYRPRRRGRMPPTWKPPPWLWRPEIWSAMVSAHAGLRFSLIACNPPYLATRLASHTPVAAVDGGPFGLSIVLRLIREAPAHLPPGGWPATHRIQPRRAKCGVY